MTSPPLTELGEVPWTADLAATDAFLGRLALVLEAPVDLTAARKAIGELVATHPGLGAQTAADRCSELVEWAETEGLPPGVVEAACRALATGEAAPSLDAFAEAADAAWQELEATQALGEHLKEWLETFAGKR